MSYCGNCKCDDCYFEMHPRYGPNRPPDCYKCGKIIVPGHYYCRECILSVRDEWLLNVRNSPISSVYVVSADEYRRMIKEAQR